MKKAGELSRGLQAISGVRFKDPQAVSNLFHQPFFEERVTVIMAENRRDAMDLFRSERINSLETLVAIRDNEKAPAAARVACCREF